MRSRKGNVFCSGEGQGIPHGAGLGLSDRNGPDAYHVLSNHKSEQGELVDVARDAGMTLLSIP